MLAFDGISQFHLAVPQTVFGLDALPRPEARYDVSVCAEEPGDITVGDGLTLRVRNGLDTFDTADVVVVPSWHPPALPSPDVAAALRRAHGRGALVVGLCLGSWVVAASGIADGRTVATHWAAAAGLARRFPRVRVRSDVLWCDLGDIVTSAGVAAALDCCLHVVRTQHGSDHAAEIARELVMAPHRTGTQAQFIPVPVLAHPGDDPVHEAMAWARSHLADPIDLDLWASAATMSRRSFTRRFTDRTGTSPMRWLTAQRLDYARRLLETTDDPVDHIAARTGFGTPETLRHHFRTHLGVSPTAHRTAFRQGAG